MECLEQVKQASSYRLVTVLVGPSFEVGILTVATVTTYYASALLAFVADIAGLPFVSHPNKQLFRGFVKGCYHRDSNFMGYFVMAEAEPIDTMSMLLRRDQKIKHY